MESETKNPSELIKALPELPLQGALPCVARYFPDYGATPRWEDVHRWISSQLVHADLNPNPDRCEKAKSRVAADKYYGNRNEYKLLLPILWHGEHHPSFTREWLEWASGTRPQTKPDHPKRGSYEPELEFGWDWVNIFKISPLRLLLHENDFSAYGDTAKHWTPNFLELAEGNALCHIGGKIVVVAESLAPADFEAFRQAGIATVGIKDALRRAREGAVRWTGRVWNSKGEWEHRQTLWNKNRPPNIHKDDPIDEVARRLLEGIYTLRRPIDAIMLPRPVSDEAWQLTPRQCCEMLLPWFKAFSRAPIRCAIPPSIVAVLDAIRHGGHWMVRPGTYVDSWNASLQTVGGELFELTFWRAPAGAEPPARCVVYALSDQTGRPYTPEPIYGQRGLADEKNEAELLEQWSQRRIAINPNKSLLWTLGNFGCGEVAFGEFRLRIRTRLSCSPSAIGGSEAARFAVRDASGKAERAREEQAKRDDDSNYYDDDDSQSYSGSGEEDLADNYGGSKEDYE